MVCESGLLKYRVRQYGIRLLNITAYNGAVNNSNVKTG